MSTKKYIINDYYLFDPMRRTLFNQSDESNTIILGNNESDILLALIERKTEVLSKELLNKLVWSDKGALVNESSVIQAISTLRKTLNDSTKKPTFILTVPKKGYQFVGRVNELTDDKPKSELDKSESEVIKESADFIATNGSKNTTLNDQKSSKLISFLVLSISAAIICACIYISSILLQKDDSYLARVESINNVPVFTLSDQYEAYTNTPQMRTCVKKLIDNSQEFESIDKIIVNLTSKFHLIINVIYFDIMKSKSYEIVNANTLSNLCE